MGDQRSRALKPDVHTACPALKTLWVGWAPSSGLLQGPGVDQAEERAWWPCMEGWLSLRDMSSEWRL